VAIPDSLDCEVILLAAGRSRRMGGVNKLLLQVEGMAMVRRSAQLYLDLGMKLTVVTGSDDREVAAALAGLDLQFIANPAADSGQHSSVRAGFAAAPLLAPGVVVALADQPLLTAADIRALVAEFVTYGGTRICVPRFAGKRGNPVIFPVAVARCLRETGMPPRAFIDAHPEQITWFEAANDHFIRDIDTPEDAAELLGTPLAPLSPHEEA
jgi:molybdenum cofactor cytidylyltransferase